MSPKTGPFSGARPPLRPRTPLLFAAASGLVLTIVVTLLVRTPGRLDEGSFADQRNGLLAHGPQVGQSVAGVQFGGHVVILLFVRTRPAAPDVTRWSEGFPRHATVITVVQRPDPAGPAEGAVVFDVPGALASAVHLPRPNDGGPGVGYAVVDASRTVRYATLDPSWRKNGFEVATIAGAL